MSAVPEQVIADLSCTTAKRCYQVLQDMRNLIEDDTAFLAIYQYTLQAMFVGACLELLGWNKEVVRDKPEFVDDVVQAVIASCQKSFRDFIKETAGKKKG